MLKLTIQKYDDLNLKIVDYKKNVLMMRNIQVEDYNKLEKNYLNELIQNNLQYSSRH